MMSCIRIRQMEWLLEKGDLEVGWLCLQRRILEITVFY
jgi:hypothetical protein